MPIFAYPFKVKGFFKVLVNTTQSDKTMKKGFTNFLDSV